MSSSYRRGPVLVAALLGAFGITCGSVVPNAGGERPDAGVTPADADADATGSFTLTTQFFASVSDFDFDAGSRAYRVPMDRGRIVAASMQPFPCTLSANRRWCVDALSTPRVTIRSTVDLPDRNVQMPPESQLLALSDDGHVYTAHSPMEPECTDADLFVDGKNLGCGFWRGFGPSQRAMVRRSGARNGVSLVDADHPETFFPAEATLDDFSIRADGRCALLLERRPEPSPSRWVHVCDDGARIELPDYELVAFHPSGSWMIAARAGEPYQVLRVQNGALESLGATGLVRADAYEAAVFAPDGTRFYRAYADVQSIPIGVEPPLSATVESYASTAPAGQFSRLTVTASGRVLAEHVHSLFDGGGRPPPPDRSLWLVHENRMTLLFEGEQLLLSSPDGERALYWTDQNLGSAPSSTLVAYDLANAVEHSRWPGGTYKPNLLWLDNDHYLLTQDQASKMQILGGSWEGGLVPIVHDLWPPHWEISLIARGPDPQP